MNKIIDGFGLYDTDGLPREFDSLSSHVIIDTDGRVSGQCLKVGWVDFAFTPAHARRNMDAIGHLFWGFAFRPDNLPGSGSRLIVALASDGSYLSGLWYTSSGALSWGYLSDPTNIDSFVQVGTATPAGVVKAGVWRSIRIDLTLDNSAGAVTVYVGKTLRISEMGVKTANLASSGAVTANQVEWRGIGPANQYHSFDDWWSNDTTGPDNNTLWGDVYVRPQTALADGHAAAWAPVGETTCAECVAVDDGDTSYIVSDTNGQVNLSALTAPDVAIGDVKAVSVRLVARKDASEDIAICPTVSNGAADNTAAGIVLTDDYETIHQTYDRNPITNAAWTSAQLADLQIGATVSL